jgi:hypothetical protein
MKYKLIGLSNFISAFFEFYVVFIHVTETLPKLKLLYEEFSAAPPSFVPTYFLLGLLTLLSATNAFIGIKLFSKSDDKSRYLKFSIILLLSTLLILGLAYAFLVSLPTYNINLSL